MSLELNTSDIPTSIVMPFAIIEAINKLNKINDLAEISTKTANNKWKVNIESPVIKRITALLAKFPDLKRDYDTEFSVLIAPLLTKRADEHINEEENKIQNDLATLLDKYIIKMKFLNLVPPAPIIKPSARALFTGTGAIASYVVRKEPLTPEKKQELYGHKMRHMNIINTDKIGLSYIKHIADILYTDDILEQINNTQEGEVSLWIDLPGDFIREYKVLKKYLRKYGKEIGPKEPLLATAKYITLEHVTYKFTSDLHWQAFLYDINTLYLQYYQMVRYATSVLLPRVYRLSEQKKQIADLQFQLKERDMELMRIRTEIRNATVKRWNVRNTRRNSNTKNNTRVTSKNNK